jgi:hypothetical protein
MLWKPVTVGELVFQRLYRSLGCHINIADEESNLEFLVTPHRFREFAQLTATLEVFLRTMRCSATTYANHPEATAAWYGKQAREDADLPLSLTSDPEFSSLLRNLGRAAHRRRRNLAIERNVLRGASTCYLCGAMLVASGMGYDSATVDHVWPLRFGGEGIEGNLAASCRDCNEKKGHAATWAWGPVQSTYEELADENAALSSQLRISLMLARIMLIASASATRSTLKEAAARIWPAAANIRMSPNRPHVYFECFRKAESTK